MRVLIAPDKFKGAISAADAAEAMAEGIWSVCAGARIELCPMADGGEGTVAALVAATNGTMIRIKVCGPLPGSSVDAEYGMLGDGQTAVIEMASASGLALVPPDKRNPLNTTTYGTGELLADSAKRGAKRIILGIGGSATVDGGIGALQALGCEIKLADGKSDGPLVGADVARVEAIGRGRSMPEILIACDVDNPLYGEKGAAKVYGPQKGADPATVKRLDEDLCHLARKTGKDELANAVGAGAAGGLGFGLCAYLGSNVRMAPGFELIAEACGFDGRLREADLCLTAEGRFDQSSLHGKTAVGVARRCAAAGKRCIVLAGSVEEQAETVLREQTGAVAMPIVDGPISLDESMSRTAELLRRAAARAMSHWGTTDD